MSALLRLIIPIALPALLLARDPKVIALPPAEIAKKVLKKDVDLRLADGTSVYGKVTALLGRPVEYRPR